MPDKILDSIRLTLYALLVLIGFFLVQAWQQSHQPVTPVSTQVNPAIATERPLTSIVDNAQPSQTGPVSVPTKSTAMAATGQIITVKTDLIEAEIDTLGGEIIELKLLNYPESLDSKSPYLLFNNDSATRYLAESGLLSQEGPDTSNGQAVYTTAAQTKYELAGNEQSIKIPLHWQSADGVSVDKVFTFSRNSYEIGLQYDIHNQSAKTWNGNFYTQLARTDTPPPNNSGLMNLATYFGAAVSSPDKRFTKITFKDMQSKELNQPIQSGWAAMVQHYFVSAWIPPKDETLTYYSKLSSNGLYSIGMMSKTLQLAPAEQTSVNAKLYAGPAKATLLENAAPGLQLTIDYGWFWFISIIIFWMLDKIHWIVGNWGWSIVIVTIIIKALFYQLSAKSYRSMSGLKRLQPKIEALKERFGDDKQKMTQSMLELYKQEKVSPMSGCLPILIQIPVFIALYWVLVESVELRQAPFILWIHDLSQHDPYYVLPLLMGVSMFFQQRLNPPPADPMQAKVMMAMPILFTFLFANFPAGLLLYWVVNNTLSFLQQWYVMQQMEKETRVVKA